MSSSILNPEPHESEKAQAGDWSRLIPGGAPFLGKGKDLARSLAKVSEIAKEVRTCAPNSPLAFFLPLPLRSWRAWRWARSVGADFALVAVNWLLIGALQVLLRGLFPSVRLFRYAAGAPVFLLGIASLHAALITLIGYTEGLHNLDGDVQGQARILAKSTALSTILLCFAYGLQGTPWPTAGLFCAASFLHFGALWTWRWQSGRQIRWRQHNRQLRNVLIVGEGSLGRRVASNIEQHPEAGRTVCGFLDNQRPIGNNVIGRVSDLARLARTRFVDEVILAAPHDRDLTLQLLREARRLRLDVEIVPDLFGCNLAGQEVERIGDLLVICLRAETLPEVALLFKRVVDVIGASLALMALAPLLGAIAALVKLDSGGTVLYCAQRAGRKGRLFRCYKFRTMVSNAQELKDHLRHKNQRSGPFFKIAEDPRVTRLGHWLRRYSLDELPQIWNVLKGDMSLVGPRPHPLDDVAGYEIEHLARLDVTPGITGLWQVSARRDPSFQRGMELDREYIRTWSLGLDLRILLRTLAAVARGSGD